MQPLTFPCPLCGRRMGVGLELAGRSVRCPHCQQVVTAPSTAAPVSARPAPPPARESVESIFSDPEESEDAVFGGGPTRPVQFPPVEAPTPPTPQPAAPAPPPPDPDEWLTADEAPSSVKGPTLNGAGPGPDDFAVAPPVGARRPTSVPFNTWRLLAVGLAVYAALATAVALWGWLR